MKRIAMTLAAAILMCSAAVAQEEQQKKGPRPEKKFDKTEMVKHRTDETVKQYSLNEKQAAKLLELNTKYADKMGPGPRGPHRGGPGRHHGMRPGPKPDGETAATPQQPKDEKKRPELTEEQKAKMKAEREEMQETMKAYDAELQKIMTDEQYKQYKADMEKRRQQGPRHHNHQGLRHPER